MESGLRIEARKFGQDKTGKYHRTQESEEIQNDKTLLPGNILQI